MERFRRLVAVDGVTDLDGGEVFVGRADGALDDVVEGEGDAELDASGVEPRT